MVNNRAGISTVNLSTLENLSHLHSILPWQDRTIPEKNKMRIVFNANTYGFIPNKIRDSFLWLTVTRCQRG